MNEAKTNFKANCFFLEGRKCLRLFTAETSKSLSIEEDDKLVVWHDGDLFLAYNPRTPEGAGEFLSYDDLRSLVAACLSDQASHKAHMNLF